MSMKTSPVNDARARPLLEQALALDPNFSAAMELLGYIEIRAAVNWQTNPDREGGIRKALEWANLAIESHPDYSGGYSLRGGCLVYLLQFKQGVAELRKAVAMEPNNPAAATRRAAGN